VSDDVEAVTLRGHERFSWLPALAWSPDGQRLASGGHDKTIKIWDVAAQSEIRTLRGHTDEVLAVCWSRNGSRLASGGKDNTVRVWDVASGKESLTLHGHTSPVTVVAWRMNDQQLASTDAFEKSEGAETKFWDLALGKEIRTLKATALTWSPDGGRFADNLGTVDASSGQRLLGLRGRTGLFLADGYMFGQGMMAWSPDGRWLAGRSGNTGITVYDAVTGEEARVFNGRRRLQFAWSPDGRHLAAGGHQGGGGSAITVWDTAPRTQALVLKGGAGDVWAVAWSPNSESLACVGATVEIWNAATGRALQTLQASGREPQCWAAWSGDGSHLASIDFAGTVRVWDTQTWQEAATLRGLPPAGGGTPGGGTGRLDWSADGRWLAAASGSKMIKVWEKGSWQEVFSQQDPQPWGGTSLVGWGRKSQRLAFEDSSGFKVWNALADREPRTVHKYEVSSGVMFWSPDERWVATADGSEVGIRPLTGGRQGHVLRGHPDFVVWVSWSPDARRVASAAHDGTIKVWDVASGQELLTFPGGAMSVEFSPDGWRIAASQGSTVRIWDASPASAEADGTARVPAQ
jgi:WD40 repeat protein